MRRVITGAAAASEGELGGAVAPAGRTVESSPEPTLTAREGQSYHAEEAGLPSSYQAAERPLSASRCRQQSTSSTLGPQYITIVSLTRVHLSERSGIFWSPHTRNVVRWPAGRKRDISTPEALQRTR